MIIERQIKYFYYDNNRTIVTNLIFEILNINVLVYYISECYALLYRETQYLFIIFVPQIVARKD